MRRPTGALGAAAAVLCGLALATVAAGCGSAAPAAIDASPRPVRPGPHFRFFAPTSFWNRTVHPGGPLDRGSRAAVAALGAEVARELDDGSGPWINTHSYSVPVLR